MYSYPSNCSANAAHRFFGLIIFGVSCRFCSTPGSQTAPLTVSVRQQKLRVEHQKAVAGTMDQRHGCAFRMLGLRCGAKPAHNRHRACARLMIVCKKERAHSDPWSGVPGSEWQIRERSLLRHASSLAIELHNGVTTRRLQGRLAKLAAQCGHASSQSLEPIWRTCTCRCRQSEA